jgi:putative membrane protein
MPPAIVNELWQLIPTIIYFFVGFFLFGMSIYIADKILPFSIRKEIEEDQNTSLGIIIGSGIIATAIILSAVLK